MADPSRHLVYGLHAVQAVVQRAPERILELWVREERGDARMRELVEQARAAGLQVQPASAATLEKLATGGVHQGVVARVRPPAAWDETRLSDLVERLTTPPLLLALDGITDPHNLGACLRSAEAAGVHAVIAPRDRSAGLDATASKVAAGAAEFVPFVTVTNLVRTLKSLQQQGLWVVGLAGEAEQVLFEVDLKGPVVLVAGAEGSGLRRLTRDSCDLLARIPMAGQVSSLNVSVSVGVALFDAVRQRIVGR